MYDCFGLSLSDRLDLIATIWALNFILEFLLTSTNPCYPEHPGKVEHTVLWVFIDGYRAIIKRLLMCSTSPCVFQASTRTYRPVSRHVASRVLNSVGYSQPAMNSTDTLSVQMDGSRDLSVIF